MHTENSTNTTNLLFLMKTKHTQNKGSCSLLLSASVTRHI